MSPPPLADRRRAISPPLANHRRNNEKRCLCIINLNKCAYEQVILHMQLFDYRALQCIQLLTYAF
uniref:Uncharacterized protein n=1 Tax=Arundo donax TaxID=35708 RepID=A0A0A9G9E5_ARUDO